MRQIRVPSRKIISVLLSFNRNDFAQLFHACLCFFKCKLQSESCNFCVLFITSAFFLQVVESGLFVKHYKVEVYLLELKLCESSNPDNLVSCHFSKADTVGK